MTSRLALPLVLAAAVGASALFWWMSTGAPADRTAPGTRPQAEAVTRAPGDLSRPVATDLGETSAQPAPKRVAREADPVAPSAASADTKEHDGPSVSGRVLDRQGEPVAGAKVLASNQTLISIDDFDAPWARRVDAITDMDGRYVLTGLDAGALQLGVRAAGFAPYDRSDLTLPADDSVVLDDIALSVGAILTGYVLDPDGNGVAGAELVNVSNLQRGSFTLLQGRREPVAVSADDGSFRVDQLACGEWSLVVETEDFPERVFKGLAEIPGQVVAGLEFVLEPGGSIVGKVTDVPAGERGRLKVRASKSKGDWMERLRGRTTDVAIDGTFELKGLHLDTEYELGARSEARADEFSIAGQSRSESVRAWAGDEGVEIPYLPEAALLIQVVDSATREPITDYQVESGVDFLRPLRRDGQRVDTHPEGRERVGELRPDGPDDRVRLRVEATGYKSYARDEIAIAIGQELDLGTIFLDPVPVVSVTVTDRRTGDPVAGARVSMRKEAPEQDGERRFQIETSVEDGHVSVNPADAEAITDSEGVALLTSLEGETVTLEVEADDFAPWTLKGIRLPRGESYDTSVELSLGGVVLVTVVDPHGEPLAGVGVSHRAPGASGMEMSFMPGMGAREVSDSEGHVRFNRLAVGTHSFKIAGSGGGGMIMGGGEVAVAFGGPDEEDDSWRSVDVMEGGEATVTLQANARGTLAGRVREAGKVLAGATVELTEEGAADDFGFGRMFGGGARLSARTDGDGNYELDGVEEGKYTVTISHPTRRMPVERDVEIREGENRFDAELPLSIIEGRLTGMDGEPLAGVKVNAERYAEDAPRQRAAFAVMIDGDGGGGGDVITSGDLGDESTVTDTDGRYTLRGVASDVDLVVRAQGKAVQSGASEPLRVEADETRRGVDFQLEAAGSIVAEIFERDGSASRFKMVRATWAGEDGGAPQMEFANDGSVEFNGLKPGTWILSASDPRPDSEVAPAEREVEVRAGETAHTELRFE